MRLVCESLRAARALSGLDRRHVAVGPGSGAEMDHFVRPNVRDQAQLGVVLQRFAQRPDVAPTAVRGARVREEGGDDQQAQGPESVGGRAFPAMPRPPFAIAPHWLR